MNAVDIDSLFFFFALHSAVGFRIDWVDPRGVGVYVLCIVKWPQLLKFTSCRSYDY